MAPAPAKCSLPQTNEGTHTYTQSRLHPILNMLSQYRHVMAQAAAPTYSQMLEELGSARQLETIEEEKPQEDAEVQEQEQQEEVEVAECPMPPPPVPQSSTTTTLGKARQRCKHYALLAAMLAVLVIYLLPMPALQGKQWHLMAVCMAVFVSADLFVL